MKSVETDSNLKLECWRGRCPVGRIVDILDRADA
jgi:hypothetical protein